MTVNTLDTFIALHPRARMGPNNSRGEAMVMGRKLVLALCILLLDSGCLTGMVASGWRGQVLRSAKFDLSCDNLEIVGEQARG